MGVVKFVRLECVKQEDWNGEDDIYITINGDQVYSTSISEDDNKRDIDQTFTYQGDVATVRMYEYDSTDDDDLLGEQIVLGDYGEMKFTEDDAYYTLSYRVIER
ncbi:hypothetical protein FCH28_30105 [Streptomyces piniterrae]|uniref:Uncharacterized protein n=1 Tax=Streptomyces piniterrae TaxID=2571125 RepID=A0A4U0MUH4_9ACTN|nr:hypothetical protein [Streptomyces piniterrae]TJZ44583.1 hypothetical protein FCH28_30105 [Streptomyces piniterrae]